MQRLSETFLVLLPLFYIITVTSACFITNCPPGGKRSVGDHKAKASRQCTACGPGGLGRCFAPELCCGSQIGCFLNTRESAICRFENLYPVPCENEAKSCGEGSDGKCAADGVCCSGDQCRFDESCHVSNSHHRMASFYQRMLGGDNDLGDALSQR